MPTDIRAAIIDALQQLPGLETTPGRRALILSAGLDAALQARIVFEGSTAEFCVLLVDTLERYGRTSGDASTPDADPLAALLDAAKGSVGREKQTEFDALIAQLRSRHMTAAPARPESAAHRRRWRLAVIALALLALAGVGMWRLRPQPPAMLPLAGVVFEAAPPHAPLAGVTVSLPMFNLSLTTGPDGRFAFQVPAEQAGEVQLIAVKPGYRAFREYPTLGNTGFNFQMQPE